MSEFVEAVCSGVAVFVVLSALYLLNRAAYVEKVAGPAPALLEDGEPVLSGTTETVDERIQRECAEQLAPHIADLGVALQAAYLDGAQRGDLEVVVPESFREEMIGWTLYGVPIRRDRLVSEPTVWPKEKEQW